MKISRRQLRRIIKEELLIEQGDPQYDYSEQDFGITLLSYLEERGYSDYVDQIQSAINDKSRIDAAHGFIEDVADDLYEQGTSVMDPNDGSPILPHQRRWHSDEAELARQQLELHRELSEYLKSVDKNEPTDEDLIQQVIQRVMGDAGDITESIWSREEIA